LNLIRVANDDVFPQLVSRQDCSTYET